MALCLADKTKAISLRIKPSSLKLVNVRDRNEKV
jgi:hypothetical protein